MIEFERFGNTEAIQIVVMIYVAKLLVCIGKPERGSLFKIFNGKVYVAPAMNSFAILSDEYPALIPDAMAIARNRAQISGRYHP